MPGKRDKPYENRTIVLPFKQRGYASLIADPKRFRAYLDKMLAEHPQLFPAEIRQGFLMKDSYHSKHMNLTIRRIEINGIAYTIRPSFVLPRLVGWTKDAQHALLLRKYSVPFWVLALIFGRSIMYWWRLEKSLGRYSIVETTVQHPDNLPPHIAADDTSTSSVQESIHGLTAQKSISQRFAVGTAYLGLQSPPTLTKKHSLKATAYSNAKPKR